MVRSFGYLSGKTKSPLENCLKNPSSVFVGVWDWLVMLERASITMSLQLLLLKARVLIVGCTTYIKVREYHPIAWD